MFGKAATGGATARREQARREMRAAIIEAARQIIVDQGVDALTIRTVASRLGYSAGALYEYFASKEAILIALYFESQDGMDTACALAVRDLPDGAGPAETLMTIGRAYREHALDRPELYRMAFGAFKTPPRPDVPQHDVTASGAFGTLVRTAERGIADGTFVNIAPIDIAYIAWSAVHGFVSLEVTGRITGGAGPGMPPASEDAGRRRRDEVFASLIRTIMSGLVRPERASTIPPDRSNTD